MYSAGTFLLKAVSLRDRTNRGTIPGQTNGSSGPETVVMQSEVVELAAHAITDYCARFHQPRVLILFDGDEPMLAGTAWFRHAVNAFRSRMPSECTSNFAIQTSGILLDDQWMDLFTELGISVIINLNGSSLTYDKQRGNGAAASPYSDAEIAIRRIQGHPEMKSLFGGVLCEVNPEDDSLQLYSHFRSLGITVMDFRLPDRANWDLPPARFSSPTPFANYLIPVFEAWWSENDPDVHIGYFDNLLRLMVGNHVQSDTAGADPLTTVVINCDGSIGPVDSLCNFNTGLTDQELSVHRDRIERVFQQPTFQKGLAGQESLCQTCRQCDLRDVCGGGYLPARFSRANGFDNPSVYCADLTKLLRHVVDSCITHLAVTA